MSPRRSFEILSYDDPRQREKWRSLCRSFKEIDIFFYPEYVYLFELKGDGKAQCFVYYDGDRGIVIYPFLIRAIKEESFLHDISPNFRDITSPYGHGGYLRNNEQVKMKGFFRKFHDFCDDNNIISEFIRFHPLLDNYSYSSAVEIREFSETIGIDLTGTADDIWKGIRPTSRNKIRKAQKNNIKIVKDEKYEKLSDFYEIYVNTMQRIGAQKYYYFSMQWFHDLVRLLTENVALFHSEYDGRIITSAIFLFTDNYIHYFLSGSVHELRNLGANNLLLYEVALWAKNRGIQFLHLGGGYKPNDPLFKFKASFSPVRKPYYIGKVVHNNVSYQYLLQKRRLMLGDQGTEGKFFPAYRNEDMGSIIIVGASGHARVCMDILLAQGKKIIGLYDDNPNLGDLGIHEYKILGNIESFISSLKDDDFIIAIGDNNDRKRICQLIIEKYPRPPINAVHPSATISPTITMGYGNFIAPGVIINADTILGNYTIINTGATIDHDCVIQDYAQISPGCNIAGNVTIEEGAFLGTGAVVIPGKTVGAWAIVGAGAVVIHDILPFTTAVGVPARVIKQHGKNREADL